MTRIDAGARHRLFNDEAHRPGMVHVVLASQSPRRRVLLRYLLDDFEVLPVDVTEVAPRRLDIGEAVEVIARKKAIAASKQRPESWTLAADTVVHYRGELMNKARSPSEARLRLASLAGEVHHVTTGLALAHQGKAMAGEHVTTRVRMDRFPPAMLDDYIKREVWVGKAGGYGIQDAEMAPYVHIEEGPWSNVVGLPLSATAEMLERFDVPCKTPPEEVGLSHHNPFDSKRE